MALKYGTNTVNSVKFVDASGKENIVNTIKFGTVIAWERPYTLTITTVNEEYLKSWTVRRASTKEPTAVVEDLASGDTIYQEDTLVASCAAADNRYTAWSPASMNNPEVTAYDSRSITVKNPNSYTVNLSYGTTSAASIDAGTIAANSTKTISSLTPNTTYYFKISATSTRTRYERSVNANPVEVDPVISNVTITFTGTEDVGHAESQTLSKTLSQATRPAYTITWKYLSAYPDTWTTTTETYDYNATPSRSAAGTVTNNASTERKVFSSWDSLAKVTANRTITAQYTLQYNVSFTNTYSTANKSDGWLASGTEVTWTAKDNYSFAGTAVKDTNKTTITSSGVKVNNPEFVKCTITKGDYNASISSTSGSILAVGTSINWTATSNYSHGGTAVGDTAFVNVVLGTTSYSKNPGYVKCTISGTRCSANKTTGSILAVGTTITWTASSGYRFSTTASTATQNVALETTSYSKSADYKNITISGSYCTANVSSGYVLLNTTITWTANDNYSFGGSSVKDTTTATVSTDTATYSKTPGYVKCTISGTNCSANKTTGSILAVGSDITWTANSDTTYKYSFTNTSVNSVTATNSKTVALGTTSYSNTASYVYYKMTLAGSNTASYKVGSTTVSSGDFILNGSTITWTASTATNTKYSYTNSSVTSPTTTATHTVSKSESVTKNASYVYYNVTINAGTNCTANYSSGYILNGTTVRFTTTTATSAVRYSFSNTASTTYTNDKNVSSAGQSISNDTIYQWDYVTINTKTGYTATTNSSGWYLDGASKTTTYTVSNAAQYTFNSTKTTSTTTTTKSWTAAKDLSVTAPTVYTRQYVLTLDSIYGSWNASKTTAADYGTTLTISSNTLKVGSTTYTFTKNSDSGNLAYTFDKITLSGTTATSLDGNGTATGRAIRKVTLGTHTYSYDGNAKNPNGTYSGYSISGATNQTNVASNYTATASLAETTNSTWSDGTTANKSITWSITSIAATLPTVWEGDSVEYEQGTATVTATGYTGGTIYYASSTTSATTGFGSWTTTKPTRTAVGTTWVKCYVKGDSNHTDSVTSSVVTIDVYAADDAQVTVTTYNRTYSASAQVLAEVKSGDAHGIASYSLGFGANATTQPTSWTDNGSISQTNAGTYYIWYKFTPDASHSNTKDPTYVGSVTISKAAGTITYSPAAKSCIYSTSSQTITCTAASGNTGTLSYTLDSVKQGSTNITGFSLNGTTLTVPASQEVNSYTITITAKSAATSNYNEATKQSSFILTINKATPVITIAGDGTYTYNDTARTLTVTNSLGNAGTIKYGTSSSSLSSSVTYSSGVSIGSITNSAATGSASITRYAQFIPTDTTNYNSSTVVGPSTITINQANGSITYNPTAQTVTYSTSAQTKATTSATGATGTISYTLNSVKNSNGTAQSGWLIDSNAKLSIPASAAVGTYTVSVTANSAVSTNYKAANSGAKTFTLTINKADGKAAPSTSIKSYTSPNSSTVAIPTQSELLAYTGSSQSPTWSYSSTYVTISTGTGDTASATNAGSYTQTASLKDVAYFSGSTSTFTVSVFENAAVTATSSDTSVVTTSVSATSSNSATVTLTYKKAGSATITLAAAATTNYSAGSGSVSVTVTNGKYIWTDSTTSNKSISWSIDKALQTWTLSTGTTSLTSGDSTTYSISGTAIGTVSASISPTTYATLSGTTITAKESPNGATTTLTVTYPGNDNYKSRTQTVNITLYTKCVAPAQSGTLTYNGSEQTASFGTPTYCSVTSGNKGTAAKSYTATFTTTDSSKYRFPGASTTKTVTWSIGQATLTATADNKSITYGDAAPTYSITYTGWKIEADKSVTKTAPTITCTYNISDASNRGVGTYTITLSGGTAPANYKYSLSNGTLTVGQKTFAVTINNKSKTYGESDPTLTYKVGSTDYNSGSIFNTGIYSETIKISLSRATGSNSGTYAITGTQDTNTTNYKVNFTNGTFTINKKELTVTASSHTVTYGDTAPTYSVSYSGFVSGESKSNLTTEPTATSAYAKTTAVSSSPVATTASGGAATNYSFKYVNGAVTINTKTVGLSWGTTTSWTYDGNAHSTTCTATGLVNSDTCTVNLSNNSVGPNVNTTGVTVTAASLSNANYKLPTSGLTSTIKITARNTTIAGNTDSKIYDATELTVTGATASNLVSGHTLLSVTGSASQTIVGSSTYTPADAVIKDANNTDVTSNYSISYTVNSGKATITSRATTTEITASATSFTYGETAPTYTYTDDNLVSGHTATHTASNAPTSSSNVGTYTVTATTTIKADSTDVSSNYTILNGTCTVTVDRAPVGDKPTTTVNKIYNGSSQTNGYTTPTGVTKSGDNSGTNVGTYTATYTPDSNHCWSDGTTNAVTVTLTISKADSSITLSSTTDSIYTGATCDVSGYVTAKTPSVDLTYEIKTNGTTTKSTISGSTVTAGAMSSANDTDQSVVVTITNPGNDNYNSSTKDFTITVMKNQYTLSFNNTTTSVAYGDTLSVAATCSQTATISYTTTGNYTSLSSSTLTGTSYSGSNKDTITASVGRTTTYAAISITRQVSVTKRAVTYTATDQSKAYDGSVLSADNSISLTSGSLVSGHTATGSCTGSTAAATAGSTGTKTLSSVTIKSGSTNVSANYSITKANGTLTINKKAITVTAPTANSLTYTGSAQTLANAGSTSEQVSGESAGTFKYKLSSGSSYSTTIPTGTNAGDYTVNWQFDIGSNYSTTSTVSGNVSVTINRATQPGTIATNSPTYGTGADMVKVTTAAAGSAIIYYAVNTELTASNYSTAGSTTIPTVSNRNAGTYTVYYYIPQVTNYNAKAGNVSVTIAKADPTFTGSNESVKYPSTANGTVIASVAGTAYYGSTSSTSGMTSTETLTAGTSTTIVSRTSSSNIGTSTVYAYFVPTDTTNYNDVGSASSAAVTVTATTTIGDGTITYSPAAKSCTFSTSSQTITCDAASGNTGTLSYTLNSVKQGSTSITGFSLSGTTLTVPASKAAGDYTVTITATSAATTNYTKATKQSSFTLTINKADGYASISNITITSINSASVDTPRQDDTIWYNGAFQTPTFDYDSRYVTITSSQEKNAGTYTETASLKNVAYFTTTTGTNSVTNNTGTISVASSSDTTVATATVSGTTVTVTGKKAGTATITLNIAASTNYNATTKTFDVTVNNGTYIWSDGTTTSKIINWRIIPKVLTVNSPTARNPYYNGTAQNLCTAGSWSGQVSGESGSNVGTFKYKLSTASTYSTTIPSQTSAGTYVVNWTFAPNRNYQTNSSTEGSVTSTINYKITLSNITGVTSQTVYVYEAVGAGKWMVVSPSPAGSDTVPIQAGKYVTFSATSAAGYNVNNTYPYVAGSPQSSGLLVNSNKVTSDYISATLPTKYAVTFTAGSGVNMWSSTSSTAYSGGNSSGTTYNPGTTVYVYARITTAGYHIAKTAASQNWTLVSGTVGDANAVYRCQKVVNAAWPVGTVNRTTNPNTGTSPTVTASTTTSLTIKNNCGKTATIFLYKKSSESDYTRVTGISVNNGSTRTQQNLSGGETYNFKFGFTYSGWEWFSHVGTGATEEAPPEPTTSS